MKHDQVYFIMNRYFYCFKKETKNVKMMLGIKVSINVKNLYYIIILANLSQRNIGNQE